MKRLLASSACYPFPSGCVFFSILREVEQVYPRYGITEKLPSPTPILLQAIVVLQYSTIIWRKWSIMQLISRKQTEVRGCATQYKIYPSHRRAQHRRCVCTSTYRCTNVVNRLRAVEDDYDGSLKVPRTYRNKDHERCWYHVPIWYTSMESRTSHREKALFSTHHVSTCQSSYVTNDIVTQRTERRKHGASDETICSQDVRLEVLLDCQ
jgi:hypothetical protein